MIQLTRKQKAAFASGEINVKDLAQDFLATYPITEIAESLAEMMVAPTVYEEKPVVLSDEDYQRLMKMFRPRGIATDGTKIMRGRPRKNKDVAESKIKCN